jgi:hypothetical protein
MGKFWQAIRTVNRRWAQILVARKEFTTDDAEFADF